MSLISMEFLTFVAVAVIGYYLIPKRYQWVWLLAFSYIYYASSGMKYLVFLLYTTVVTYGTARLIYGADQKFADQKEKIKTYKKSIMLLALLLDFGMLAVLKYTNFTISNINTLFHTDIRMVKFLLPLGISFYTFQSVGYILDVYWKRYEPEKNIFKFALFVSFFPQILQGPIGRYSNLAHQFYEEHSFDFMRIERGVQRVLWGFFKKMVIADTAAVFVDAIFDQYQTYNGLAIFGVLAYSAQLYGDFSGGMDVVIGIASMFGIEMDENFKRPYFSISITDFWHRWHITLGTWMKDYLFYPLSLSKGMGKFGKFAKKTFGKTYGRALPICVANIVVFLVVGIWHGAAWKFIVYGLYNGIIIGFSGLMAKNYRDWKKKLKIKSPSRVVRDKIGKYMPLGLAAAFTKYMPEATTKMGKDIDVSLATMRKKVESVEYPKPDTPNYNGPGGNKPVVIVQDNKPVEVNAEIHTTVDLDGKTVGKQITPYVNRNLGEEQTRAERRN